MIYRMYRWVLRGPSFRGRHRIETLLRKRLKPRSDNVPGGIRMMLDPQEWLQIDLMSGRATEPLTAALFEHLLHPGDVLIDVGAHVGWLTLIGAKAVGPTGIVIAIEPQPYNCDRILSNAELNGLRNVTVVAGAIGEKPGPVQLSNQSATDKSRLTLDGPGANDTGLRFLTQLYSLSQLVELFEIPSVKLLKVDVEGFEMPVFRGAAPVLDRIQNIAFEHLPEHQGNFQSICSLLGDAGFELLTVNGQPLTGSAPPENNIWARRRA